MRGDNIHLEAKSKKEEERSQFTWEETIKMLFEILNLTKDMIQDRNLLRIGIHMAYPFIREKGKDYDNDDDELTVLSCITVSAGNLNWPM